MDSFITNLVSRKAVECSIGEDRKRGQTETPMIVINWVKQSKQALKFHLIHAPTDVYMYELYSGISEH